MLQCLQYEILLQFNIVISIYIKCFCTYNSVTKHDYSINSRFDSLKPVSNNYFLLD